MLPTNILKSFLLILLIKPSVAILVSIGLSTLYISVVKPVVLLLLARNPVVRVKDIFLQRQVVVVVVLLGREITLYLCVATVKTHHEMVIVGIIHMKDDDDDDDDEINDDKFFYNNNNIRIKWFIWCYYHEHLMHVIKIQYDILLWHWLFLILEYVVLILLLCQYLLLWVIMLMLMSIGVQLKCIKRGQFFFCIGCVCFNFFFPIKLMIFVCLIRIIFFLTCGNSL